MNILVVTAHPLEESLCGSLSSYTIGKLKKLGHNVITDNLYANKFDPVLNANERSVYYQKDYEKSDVLGEVTRLENADALVMIFPTWWFSFPAILKGWFDRVWVPTVAYDHSTDFGPIKPKLSKLQQTFVITTLGAPWWVDYLILWRPVKRVIHFALLGACAKKCKLSFLSFYKCEKVNKDRIKTFHDKIDKRISKIF